MLLESRIFPREHQMSGECRRTGLIRLHSVHWGDVTTALVPQLFLPVEDLIPGRPPWSSVSSS